MPFQFIQDSSIFISRINQIAMSADLNQPNIQQKIVVQQAMESDSRTQSNVESLAFQRQSGDKVSNWTNKEVQMARAQLLILECIEVQKKVQIAFTDLRKQFGQEALGDQVINLVLEKFTSQSKLKRTFDQATFQSAQNCFGNIVVFITNIVRRLFTIILKKQQSLFPTLVFGSRKSGKTVACFIIQSLTDNFINTKIAGKTRELMDKLPKKLFRYLLAPKLIIISINWIEKKVIGNVIKQCKQLKFSTGQQDLGLNQLLIKIQKEYRNKQISIVIILDQLTKYYQRIESYLKQAALEHKTFLLRRIRQMQRILCCVKDVFGHSIVGLLEQDTNLNIIEQFNENIKFDDLLENNRQNMASQYLHFYDKASQKENCQELNRITLYQMMKILENSVKYMDSKRCQFIIKQVYQQWKQKLIKQSPKWSFYSNYAYIKQSVSSIAPYLRLIVEQYLQGSKYSDEFNQSKNCKVLIEKLIIFFRENLKILGKSGKENQRKWMIKFSNQLDLDNKKHHIRLMKLVREIAEDQIEANQKIKHIASYFDVPMNRLCQHFNNGLKKDKLEQFSTFKHIDLMKNKLFYQKYFVFKLKYLRIYIPPADFINFTSYICDQEKQQWQQRLQAMTGQQKGKQYEEVAISIMSTQQNITVQLGEDIIQIRNLQRINFIHFHHRMKDINLVNHIQNALNALNKIQFNTYIGCVPQFVEGEWADNSASFDLLLICQQSLRKYMIRSIDFTINSKTNDLFAPTVRIDKTKYGKANSLIKKIKESSQYLFFDKDQINFDWWHYIVCPTSTCDYVKQNKAKSTFLEPQENVIFIPIKNVKIQGIADGFLNQAYQYFLKLYSTSQKKKKRTNNFISCDQMVNSASDRDSTPKNDRSRTRKKTKNGQRQQQAPSPLPKN